MPYKDSEHNRLYQKLYRNKRKNSHRCVKVTLSLTQFTELESYATSNEETVAKTLKRLAHNQLGNIVELSPDTRSKINEIIFLIRNISNNANQLAHSANIQVLANEPLSASDGTKQLRFIHQELVQLEILVKAKLA